MSNANAVNIYQNIEINPKNKIIPAEIQITHTDPFLNYPEKYNLSIPQFNIPLNQLPLLFLINKNFKVGIEYLGVFTERNVEYTNNHPNDLYERFEPVYETAESIDLINDAILGAIINSGAPNERFYFDYQRNNLSFESLKTISFKVYLNEELYNYFNGFQAKKEIINNQVYYEIIIKDNFNNTSPDNPLNFITNSEYDSRLNWSDLRTILFKSNRLNIESEIFPTSSDESSVNITKRILYDYEPVLDKLNKTNIVYNSRTYQREIDILANQPLQDIDFKLVWIPKKNFNTEYRLYVKQPVYIKLQFREVIFPFVF